MSDPEHKKLPEDTETILMALDQVSQTIDVMTSVVSRLRSYIEQQAHARSDLEPSSRLESNQTLH